MHNALTCQQQSHRPTHHRNVKPSPPLYEVLHDDVVVLFSTPEMLLLHIERELRVGHLAGVAPAHGGRRRPGGGQQAGSDRSPW